MKTLFIIVSLIAFSYLALQTSFVKNHLASFVQIVDFSSVNNQTENNANKSFVIKINALEMQSARDKEMYTQRISELEDSVKALNQKQSDSNGSKSNEQNLLAASKLETGDLPNTSALINKVDKVSLVQQGSQEELTELNRANSKPATVQTSKAQISQQQKRLQQQAMLRSLADKMELAALNSLTN